MLMECHWKCQEFPENLNTIHFRRSCKCAEIQTDMSWALVIFYRCWISESELGWKPFKNAAPFCRRRTSNSKNCLVKYLSQSAISYDLFLPLLAPANGGRKVLLPATDPPGCLLISCDTDVQVLVSTLACCKPLMPAESFSCLWKNFSPIRSHLHSCPLPSDISHSWRQAGGTLELIGRAWRGYECYDWPSPGGNRVLIGGNEEPWKRARPRQSKHRTKRPKRIGLTQSLYLMY